MPEALLWGLVAGSSLVVGGALALTLPISRLALGLIMAFGTGVLISAVAYDLVDDAVRTSAGSGASPWGCLRAR
jgi:zinc transporter, ZIP family